MALILDGIVTGLQLAMLAIGLTLIYGLAGVLNLAHGQFAVVTAILAAVLIGDGMGVWPALTIAILAAGVLALLLDTTLMRPVYRLYGGERVLLSLLLTLGAAFVIDGVVGYYYPLTALSLRVPGASVQVLGVTMRSGAMVASGLSLFLLVALIAFLRYTKQGKAIRSVIQNEEGARLVGINPGSLRTAVFIMSGILAGFVAVAQGLMSSVGAAAGFPLTTMALIVTVVGGLGSVSGALLAGLLLGVVHTLASFYLGAFFTIVILLLTAMVTILVRPSGLMGREVS